MHHQAEESLENWRQWRAPFQTQPRIVKQLEGGLTNTNYVIEAGSHRAVLRINNPDADQLGVCRQTELTVLKKLQSTAVVPRLYFSDSKILVSEYIDGFALDAGKALESPVKKQIEQAIAVIQSVQIADLAPRNYQSYCRQYCNQLSTLYLGKSITQSLLQIADNIDRQEWAPVLCHHDLIPENIIMSTRGLFFIDWEYAALGHPQFDYIRLLNSHHIMDIPPNICGLQALQAILVQLWYAIRYPELQATVRDELINVIRTVNAQ
ncbi:MAG: phosphotransferase [Porticoccaceae bacterium]